MVAPPAPSNTALQGGWRSPEQQKAVSIKGLLGSSLQQHVNLSRRHKSTGSKGRSEVQGHPWPHRKLEASLDYRPQKQLNKKIQKFSTTLSTDNTNNQNG